jgi:hypothetical protein
MMDASEPGGINSKDRRRIYFFPFFRRIDYAEITPGK